eukprot:9405762-Pyramimonas_sp.AAC.1
MDHQRWALDNPGVKLESVQECVAPILDLIRSFKGSGDPAKLEEELRDELLELDRERREMAQENLMHKEALRQTTSTPATRPEYVATW